MKKVAKLSCQNATEQEKILSLENGNSVDTDGLVGITCSYDNGWQKRGRACNSSTGHGAVRSLNSGNVLSNATRNKKCRTCQNSKSKGKPPKVHDCQSNYKGSSKYMETDVTCQLFNDAIKDQVKCTCYVADDDNTTLAE